MAGRLEQIITSRKQKINNLQDKGINPYAYSFDKTHTVAQIKKTSGQVSAAGRVLSIRGHGALTFLDLVDYSGKIQVLLNKKELKDTEDFVRRNLDSGDFIGVQGKVFTTKTGELTIKASSLTLLSKSLRPPPSKWHGLKDKERRFRKRYLDLILNQKALNILNKRWQIEKETRKYLWGQGYHEVETPILQNLYGGTNARPFTTHLNALKTDLYLRIAPELYLKRLIVGGYEKVFEIARNFRNEGLDQTHQPEFTMVEFYQAYADYHRIMDITEGLVKHLAKTVNGSLKLRVGKDEVNLSGKWQRMTIDEAVKKYLNIDWQAITNKEVKEILNKHQLEVPGIYNKNKALFIIYDHLATPKLKNPIWITDYPREVSPLAKAHRSKADRVERFEGYIGGKEIFDGWSEIISSQEQRSRFQQEQKNLKSGDQEAMPLDEDFLTCLAYGCPPLGGIGFGIDRLVMFLTNTWSIRETIAFPLLRPKK